MSTGDAGLASRRAILSLGVAGAALGVGLWAADLPGCLRHLLGPPAVSAAEAYADAPEGRTFDHSPLDTLLRAHVDADGLVDYEGLGRDGDALDAYLATLASAPFDRLGRDERLALLINAYNAFTLRLVLDHWPLDSIKDIPSRKRWDARRFRLAGETVSLNQIEHERIRLRFREPRVHFALVCAARSCPPLRAEAYVGDRLEAQLADQTRRVHSGEQWLRFEPASGTLRLTKLYDWYESDFLQVTPSVEEYVAAHVPSLRAFLDTGRSVKIRWLPYDWTLNGRR
jgi:hypothetical protein